MKKYKNILIISIILIILIVATVILYKKYFQAEDEMQYTSKEDIFLLLDKGLNSSSYVNIFIVSRDSLEDEYTKILNEGKYRDLIGFVDLSKYKGSEFKFTFLQETEERIIGYFSEENSKINGTTYIQIDKSSGELRDLDNNLLKVTIY